MAYLQNRAAKPIHWQRLRAHDEGVLRTGYPACRRLAARAPKRSQGTQIWTLVLTEIHMFNTRQAPEQPAPWEE
jgi:hypothetical protein